MSLVTLLGETWDVVDGGTGLLVFWSSQMWFSVKINSNAIKSLKKVGLIFMKGGETKKKVVVFF